jgi:predicted LPLAT superfamily acyltransferase
MAEIGSAWGLDFLYWTYRLLGRWPFRAALAPVVAYFLLFSGVQRRASADFLRKAGIRGPLAPAVARHFWSFSEALLDKVIAWKGGIRLEDTVFEGREPVQALLDRGRGFLLVGSHLGNLEVSRVLSRQRPGLAVHVLVHNSHAENFNRLLRRLDPTAGVNLVQVAGFGPGQAAWVAERIGKGEVVLIAGDRTPVGGGRTLDVEFLGSPAAFAQGPFVMAAALGCPVFLMFCLKESGRFRIVYEPFASGLQLPRAGREEALRQVVVRYASRLEHYCRLAPYQWFNFYPFWSSQA